MNFLKKGNQAYKNADYNLARKFYTKALVQLPELKSIIQFNLDRAVEKLAEDYMPLEKLSITVVIISWDVCHNALGRAYMLAEALTRSVENVVLMGFEFEGNDVWEPLKGANIPVISFSGKMMPNLLDEFENIVEQFKPDLVIGCKPRLPSVELALFFKQRYSIPFIVDVDDNELSFVNDAKSLTMQEFLKMDKEVLSREMKPNSEIWTRVSQDLCKYADATIVSNTALQRDFGGTVIPHVRDEDSFDTDLYSKDEQRKRYNIPLKAKVVMFFGTPRHHKGVSVIAKVVGDIEDDDFLLVVVGNSPERTVFEKLSELSKNKTVYLPNQPFGKIPEIICMADVVCLPQDENSLISKYQLPAKAIDAIAMGIPLLVTKTEPLIQLVEEGLAKAFEISELKYILIETVGNTLSQKQKKKNREVFIEKYSYYSFAKNMKKIIEDVLKTPLNPLDGLDEFVDFQRNIFFKNHLQISKKTHNLIYFCKKS